MEFFVSAPRGAASYLSTELAAMGIGHLHVGASGVGFQGSLEEAYRVCLWSRIASRVLLQLTILKVRDEEELYREIKAIRWEKHLDSAGTLAVDINGSHPRINHSRFAALKIKDAVVDRLREQFGERPSVDVMQPDVRIHGQLRRDGVRLSIDLSGRSLHERGYRAEGGRAPLKENLAALILCIADWDGLAARGAPLVDPLCGSGTLLIEAAMMAADRAPGLKRDYYGFLGWKRHEPHTWQHLLEEAAARFAAGSANLPPIVGYDRSAEAIALAHSNIERAGLSGHIRLQRRELEQAWELPAEPAGLLVSNPPYGERLGEVEQLHPLYARLGEIMRHDLSGWRAVLFTANAELAARTGWVDRHPVILFNGPIECRVYRYDLDASVAVADVGASEGAKMFANRLRKNWRHVRKWAQREGIGCYRIYDADLPEYAVAIDLYEAGQRWLHVQEYAPPKTIDRALAHLRLNEIMAQLPQVLDVPPAQIVLKVRSRQKGAAQYRKQAHSGHFLEVSEGPCRLWVNLQDYLDTGLFLDHRITRGLIGEWARDKRFLNLFAYTAVASLHAALGGAISTTSVDMSNTYLDWARRNFHLNGLEGDAHQWVRADCTLWLQQQAGLGRQRFDLIFLDPPTFSTSKSMENSFDIQRQHAELIDNAMKLLDPQGLLVFSTNFRKFRLDASVQRKYALEDISRQSIPEDFRRSPGIHRCWLVRHLA
jgi:23S rRNA (guanine2445-N2)-methyltransferase / 23S rRNA (guanine2069-N7)-methyltransferase